MVVIVGLILALALLVLGTGFVLHLVGSLQPRDAASRELTDLRARVLQLEDSLTAMSDEQRQLREAVDFTNRLLTERASTHHPPAERDEVP